jgi:uncharacterized protein (TIGR03437 family)
MRLIFALCVLLAASLGAQAGSSYTIDTVAGSDWIGDGGPALEALLRQPEGIASDALGNLYVSDAADHRVRKISTSGVITTVAGTGAPGYAGDGGPAIAARLFSPYGLACDGRGNLFIADLGNARVRRVDANGAITTVAGGGATAISLVAPRNLALDGYGNLYISDFGANRVYRLSSVGSAMDGSLVTWVDDAAHLSYPAGLALDRQGALYIADSENHTVRKVANGVVTSVFRAATPAGLAFDGVGSLWVADLSSTQLTAVSGSTGQPVNAVLAHDVTYRPDGYMYTVDGHTVRRIGTGNVGFVIAGQGTQAHGDNGPATQALLNHPSGVAVDAAGNLYIADRDNRRIRRVSADGTITTVAASMDVALDSPSAVSVDAAGNAYVVDSGSHRIFKFTPAGAILDVPVPGVLNPVYTAVDALGNLFVADAGSGAIRKLDLNGAVTTVLAGLSSPQGIAIDNAGRLYVADASAARVWRLDSRGTLVSLADGAWNIPRSVAVDSSTGEVFVADSGLQRILRVDPAGKVSVVAGDGVAGFAGDGAPALAARLAFPWDIALDLNGTLYIADLNNNRVRRLTPSPQSVVTPPLPELDFVNAASLQSGPIAPGMLFIVRGTDFDASTQVQIAGVSAVVLSRQTERLVLQAPTQIPLGLAMVDLVRRGEIAARSSVQIAATAPALFADASGQAAAVNTDGTLNDQANPAPRGSVIALYATGEGVSGAPIAVSIGGYPADVLYAGPVSGNPGLLQVNSRIPAGYVPRGSLPVRLTVGEATSQSGVTISVD